MTRWKELPPKKQLLIGLSILVILAAGLIAFFTIFHTAKKQNLKANADLILELDGKEAYLPCRVGDAPFRFDPPPRNALTPISKSTSSDTALKRNFPEGRWDGEHRFELIGYNNSGGEIELVDYMVRGVWAVQSPDVVVRGGKLGADRKEFVSNGIQCGDSIEDVRRILGDADKVTAPDKSELYFFDDEAGGRYMLSLLYVASELYQIELSYTVNALPNS